MLIYIVYFVVVVNFMDFIVLQMMFISKDRNWYAVTQISVQIQIEKLRLRVEGIKLEILTIKTEIRT